MSIPGDPAPRGVRDDDCLREDRPDNGSEGLAATADPATADAATDAATDAAGDEPAAATPIDWERLPEAVRGRLAEVAATAVGAMTPVEVPVPLRRLARWTPAKRAKLGAASLLTELARGPGFRAQVVAWWAEHRPAELVSDADDPLTAAAAAVLVGDAAAAAAVAAAARRGEVGELRAELDAALSRVDKLTLEMERLRGELTESRAKERTAGTQRDVEYQQLRRRVSEQGARLRAAADAQASAERAVEHGRRSAERELAALRDQLERERDRAAAERRRADRAAAEVAAARQAAREARKADEVRLGLLLDTLGGAVTGLRHELAIGGGGPRPADLVVGAQVGRTGGAVDNLAALDALLTVNAVHLIVDGYNVSKTGYPELPLADQRTRLAGQLAALAARTGVEITVVFDGAGVTTAPTRGGRGLRVLFSDPGVLADDVIRDLVAAEPQGRPVLVATSDRAVVESVRIGGAHTVPSAILLGRLTRS
jgi:predicted RNA-binding protein with PIN domain